MAKEAYLSVKRGLFIWQMRPIYMAKELSDVAMSLCGLCIGKQLSIRALTCENLATLAADGDRVRVGWRPSACRCLT